MLGPLRICIYKVYLVIICFFHFGQQFQILVNLQALLFIVNYLTHTFLDTLLILISNNLFNLLKHFLTLHSRLRHALLFRIEGHLRLLSIFILLSSLFIFLKSGSCLWLFPEEAKALLWAFGANIGELEVWKSQVIISNDLSLLILGILRGLSWLGRISRYKIHIFC